MKRFSHLALLALIVYVGPLGSVRLARENFPEWSNAPADREPANAGSAHKESWRAGVKLPTLITDKLLTYDQVCAEARHENETIVAAGGAPRKFALVLAKMHLCDYMTQACMHAARTYFDPCNHFVRDNFIPFHARTYFDGGAQPPGGKEMVKLYESPSGPRLVAIDLKSCRALTHTTTSEAGQTYVETGIEANSERMLDDHFNFRVYTYRSPDRNVRFAEMRTRLHELLAATPGEAEKIDAREWDKDPSAIGCLEGEHYPVLKDPEFVPEIRILMNEQFEAVTGGKAKAMIRWPTP